jgi:hypothetical protein
VLKRFLSNTFSNTFILSALGFIARPYIMMGIGGIITLGTVWTIGRLTTPIVPIIKQQVLTTWTLTGSSILESNNPERIDSPGWLYQSEYPDEKRGGNRATLQGDFRVYVSHINGQETLGYFQIIATNPNKTPLIITFTGSVLTSREAGDGQGVLGKSNYYQVSEKALSNSLPRQTKSIDPGKTVLLSLKRLNPKTSVDGLLQVHSTGGVFVSVVATKTPYVEEGVRLLAARQPATGNIKPPSSRTFGTGAGIYPTWGVKATPTLDLLPTVAHLGLSINYADYELNPTNPNVQTALCQRNAAKQSLCLRDSSPRSQGNYGREYTIMLNVVNPNPAPQTVRVWFASNGITANRTLLYNGAVSFNNAIQQVITTPSRPRQQLTSTPLLVKPQSTLTIPLRFFIPGLSSAGKAIIVETQP